MDGGSEAKGPLGQVQYLNEVAHVTALEPAAEIAVSEEGKFKLMKLGVKVVRSFCCLITYLRRRSVALVLINSDVLSL